MLMPMCYFSFLCYFGERCVAYTGSKPMQLHIVLSKFVEIKIVFPNFDHWMFKGGLDTFALVIIT